MTLVEHNGEFFVFELLRRERQMFASLLELYPVLNSNYHQLTRKKTRDTQLKESQELLTEAMAHQRSTNKKAILQFLAEENWEKHGSRYRVKLTGEKIEWLLQLLNDVRVGSWVILGSPDPENGERPEVSVEDTQYVGALEFSGFFQMALLQAKER